MNTTNTEVCHRDPSWCRFSSVTNYIEIPVPTINGKCNEGRSWLLATCRFLTSSPWQKRLRSETVQASYLMSTERISFPKSPILRGDWIKWQLSPPNYINHDSWFHVNLTQMGMGWRWRENKSDHPRLHVMTNSIMHKTIFLQYWYATMERWVIVVTLFIPLHEVCSANQTLKDDAGLEKESK
jgi:hypothetical protein